MNIYPSKNVSGHPVQCSGALDATHVNNCEFVKTQDTGKPGK